MILVTLFHTPLTLLVIRSLRFFLTLPPNPFLFPSGLSSVGKRNHFPPCMKSMLIRRFFLSTTFLLDCGRVTLVSFVDPGLLHWNVSALCVLCPSGESSL